jgi:serine/threonine-protein kinase RsbT
MHKTALDMTVFKTDTIRLGTEEDVVKVRQSARTWAMSLGMSLVNQTKIVTAASELARNTVKYGGGGEVLLESVEENGRRGLRLTFEDKGPGIADIGLALQDGYTSAGGLGLGLGGAKRLVNDFEIASRPGEGTRIVILRWTP